MVDFTKKIKFSDKFRKPALEFLKTGQYCQYPKGTSEYINFWTIEQDRCINGYTADDGDFISGYNYFYLNYCPINRIVNKEINGKVKSVSEVTFPDFWDYDYYYFQTIEEAQEQGKHLCVLKSRRKGYSYKCAAMLCRNYYLIPNSASYVYASNKQYLTDDGVLTKSWNYMDFIDEHTAWGKKRSVNTQLRRRAGMWVKDEYGNQIEVGYKSEIIGVTLKDNPDVIRGKKANLIMFEEAGSFKELSAAWQIARPSVEIDGKAFGTMIAYGCVCAGSRVWTADGNCVNIEDLNIEDGIIGWDTYQAVPQNISNLNPPANKPCLRITTNSGRTIECSIDHPLLWSTPGKTTRVEGCRKDNERKKAWLWHKAELCKVGEQIGIINEIPIFGKNRMWEPRLIGWLIGDGSYGYDKTPRISNCDKDILQYIESNFDTRLERSYLTKEGKEYKELRIKGICPKLRELGIYGQTKGNKRLPINIHTYDWYTLTELIGGLFDTDGYVRVDKDGRVRLILTQCQKEILMQVQEVLLHFGVHASVRHIKSDNREHYSNGKLIKSKNGEWRLEINDITSVAKFAENISLTVDYKQSALDMIWLFVQGHLAKHRKYVCGIHAEKIVKIEDIGIKPIYNLTAKEQNNYIVNGIVTHNTGGDEESNFFTLKDMFYHPEGYNCLALPNIWDENVTNTECGFFIPQYTNMDLRDENGKRMYMDEDGNTLTIPARTYILEERRKVIEHSTSSVAVDRYVAERPITPQEACLEFNGNIFPKKELQEQLGKIRTNKLLSNHKQVGDLIWESDGSLKWLIKKNGDITHYPLNKNDDPTGSIVIWEHPVKDTPNGLYIMGCLTPREKVLTDQGLMNVEDVDLSRKLINKDGELVNIHNLQRYYVENENIYKVKVSNTYRTTTFTKEHPLYIAKPEKDSSGIINEDLFNFDFVKMKDACIKDWIKVPNIYNTYKDCSIEEFVGDTEFWFFIGTWLGDGWCDKNGRICVVFNKTEIDFYEQYKQIVTNLFNKPFYCRTRGNTIECSFAYKELADYLTTNFGKYANGKYLPEWSKYNSWNKKVQLLAGYLNSDGCVTRDKRGYYSMEFVSVNLELLESIQDIMFSLGYVGNLTKLRDAKRASILSKETDQKEAFHLRFGHNDTVNFVKDTLDELNDLNTKLSKIDLSQNFPYKF